MEENSTVQDALTAVLGEYAPVANTYTVTRSEVVVVDGVPQTYSYDETVTDYGFNWNWFGGLLIFCIITYSFFRAVGGMLKCKI